MAILLISSIQPYPSPEDFYLAKQKCLFNK